MENLKERLGTAILLITHDLGVVAQVCDRVVVMYAGQIVESAPVNDLFHSPQHPYTRGLLDSLPKSGPKEHGKLLPAIPGIVPSLWNLPSGCRFHERCSKREARCQTEAPLLTTGIDERSVRCFFPVESGVVAESV